MLDPQRWSNLLAQLNLPQDIAIFERLSEAYREPQRYYHTAEHISNCLERLDHVAEFAKRPQDIELAIWFHDAIYQPMRSDNERKSADWALKFLNSVNAPLGLRAKIEHYILATKIHERQQAGDDLALFMDIDLSILGSDEEIFTVFETNVRREYRWVPAPIYRNKRRKLLQGFLARPKIYSSAWFQQRYEALARHNLARAIAALA